MLSPAEGRRQRKELFRSIRIEERRKQRAALAELHRAVQAAREARRGALKQAKHLCSRHRREIRARLKGERARLLIELRERARREKAAARENCDLEIGQARDLVTKHQVARQALIAERTYRAEIRRIERGQKAAKKEAHRTARARERARESDEEVTGNLEPHLIGLWHRVKSRIKGSDRMSRTEAFLHYAEEHPHEYLEAIEDRTEAMLRDLEEKERHAHRALKRAIPRHVLAKAAGEVPF